MNQSTFEKSELGRIDVPEDVHGSELFEADGAVYSV